MVKQYAEQRTFRFSPLRGEPVNIARTGLDLDWRRVGRRARRMLAAHLRQSGDRQPEILASGFALRRRFDDQGLFDELRSASRRKARELRRAARESGLRLRGSVILACLPEGRRVQAALDYLDARISSRERFLLCG